MGTWRRAFLGIVALLAAVSLAKVLSSYAADIRQARARIATGAAIVRTPCGPIQYAVAGEGPPVLVIHGAGGGFDQGLDIGAPLVRAGFQVIAVSRFGYLGTPLPADASAAAQARAHACLLDALGIRGAAVIGASAGAPSAIQFALLFPERAQRLVLLVPASYAPRPGGAPSVETPEGVPLLFDTALRSDFLFWAAMQVAPDFMIRAILGTPPEVVHAASADEQARVARMLEHVLPVMPRRLGLENDAAVTSSLGPDALEKILVPTLAVSARDDLYGTAAAARYAADHVRNASLVVYPSGGHLLVGHEREETAEIVAFLNARS